MFKFGVQLLITLNFVLPTWQMFLPSDMSSGAYAVITQTGTITQINLSTGKQEEYVVPNATSIFAIELDIKHDCLFWADGAQSKIGRTCVRRGINGFIESVLTETLVQLPFGRVEGMSYDWVSGLLYFVDASRSKIEVIKPSDTTVDRLRRTIVRAANTTQLRSIVVHPRRGFLFWTDWKWNNPSISRSNLDGSDLRELLKKPEVGSPQGITIDYKQDFLYWTDSTVAVIGRCDLDGNKRSIIARTTRFEQQPYAIGIHGHHIYFNDLVGRHIYKVNKDTGNNLGTLAQNKTVMVDMKIFDESSQTGSNVCSENHNCSHICVGIPDEQFSCLCPEGMISTVINETKTCVCPGLKTAPSNGTCPPITGNCPDQFFQCADKLCIHDIFACDGHVNCYDGSDEMACEICSTNEFKCPFDGKCIPKSSICDQIFDCSDARDEADCPSINCKDDEFRCTPQICIPRSSVCDGHGDCWDFSDESDCRSSNSTCNTDSFTCNNGMCISLTWKCDGTPDCGDESDENNCEIPLNERFIEDDFETPRPYNAVIKNVTFDPTNNSLKWTISNDSKLNGLNFNINYGTEIKLDEAPKIETQNMSTELHDLDSCEMYTAWITVTELSYSEVVEIHDNTSSLPFVLRFHTPYDKRLPPRIINAHANSITNKLKVTWEHSCNIKGEHPQFYEIQITDLIVNETSIQSVKYGPTNTMSYEFNVRKGGIYNVTIFPEIERSISAFAVIHGPRLPTPKKLEIIHTKWGTYNISWSDIQYNETLFEYEILVAKGLIINDTIPLVLKLTAKKPPIYIDPIHLLPSLTNTTNYTVGVRIKTLLGYTSMIDQFKHIEVCPPIKLTITAFGGMSKWWILCETMVILTIMALVIHFVMKKRGNSCDNDTATATAMWRGHDVNNDTHSTEINSVNQETVSDFSAENDKRQLV